MTEIKFPNCGVFNKLAALQCTACSLPFSNLPSSAFVMTAEPERPYEPFGPADAYNSQLTESFSSPVFTGVPGRPASDLGPRTFFWYRVYCGVLAGLYMLVAVMGAWLAFARPAIEGQSAAETLILGAVYGLMGAVFFLAHLIAALLPPKPYNWIVGIVFLAIGMTSCCLWPAVIPLLIYWVKPETREFFGRK